MNNPEGQPVAEPAALGEISPYQVRHTASEGLITRRELFLRGLKVATLVALNPSSNPLTKVTQPQKEGPSFWQRAKNVFSLKAAQAAPSETPPTPTTPPKEPLKTPTIIIRYSDKMPPQASIAQLAETLPPLYPPDAPTFKQECSTTAHVAEFINVPIQRTRFIGALVRFPDQTESDSTDYLSLFLERCAILNDFYNNFWGINISVEIANNKYLMAKNPYGSYKNADQLADEVREQLNFPSYKAGTQNPYPVICVVYIPNSGSPTPFGPDTRVLSDDHGVQANIVLPPDIIRILNYFNRNIILHEAGHSVNLQHLRDVNLADPADIMDDVYLYNGQPKLLNRTHNPFICQLNKNFQPLVVSGSQQ